MADRVPNLDRMQYDLLVIFANKHEGGHNYKSLFADVFPGILATVNDLALYATCVIGERWAAEVADPVQALVFKGLRKDIWARLPARARWRG